MSLETDAIDRLLALMAKLRHPSDGCPWDVEQDFATIAPYTIEEAYEVADAIARGDMPGLSEELGDLLFQVVFHARMAEERGAFAFVDVVRKITDKMIARHPHVFGGAERRDAEAQIRLWEDQKAQERDRKLGLPGAPPPSALDDVPLALPALARAQKLQKRASRIGFDWADARLAHAKVAEEQAEVAAALEEPGMPHVAEEIGDLIFAAVNVARLAGIDAESALRAANAKFERRFRAMEAELASSGQQPGSATLDQMESAWSRVKADERR
ncbi:MAG: nucleoside triphosphate pyrophosphohydrolase [Rhodospirillales bacterium]|jgi:MazG family protein